jgi:hypothetical protein
MRLSKDVLNFIAKNWSSNRAAAVVTKPAFPKHKEAKPSSKIEAGCGSRVRRASAPLLYSALDNTLGFTWQACVLVPVCNLGFQMPFRWPNQGPLCSTTQKLDR